jgi:hypothetical protein
MFSDHLPAVSTCNPFGDPDAAYLMALHDNVPPAVAPGASDPDAGTANLTEQTGVTGANASSDASAYGVRYTLGPTGAEGAATNATVLATGTCDLDSYLAQTGATMGMPITLHAPPLAPQYHAFCNSDGRSATFAHVDKVSLDASEARATAITGDTDRETGRDLQVGTDYSQPGTYVNSVTGFANTTNPAGSPAVPAPCPAASPAPPPATPTPTPAIGLPPPPDSEPTTCDQHLRPVQPFATGVSLPYLPASCGDNGTGSGRNESHAPLQAHGLPTSTPLKYPGSASVQCSFAQLMAIGHADQSSTSAGGPIAEPAAAMTATADATVVRNATDGSTATATAIVKNVAIGGFLHIDALKVKATALSHGRPGSNVPSYSCSVTGLTVSLPANVSFPSGVPTSIPEAPCSDSNVQAVTDALNGIFTGNLHIEFPRAPTIGDNPPGGVAGAVQRQSPRGYLSQVALSDLDQIQNTILTNDTSIEQPGLVVTYYLDNAYSRNHLVASFAGVAAAARYGIFQLNNMDTAVSDGPTSTLPDSGVVSPVGPGVATAGGAGSEPGSATPGGGGGGNNHRDLNPLAIARAVVDGFRFLFQHPQLIPSVLAVWLLFVGPGYLLTRRRALLSATEGAA